MEIDFGSNTKKSRALERSLVSKITKKIEKFVPTDSDDDIQIMVTEVQCFEPDCVPIETLVILLGRSARWTQKILKPMVEVTDDDVAELQIPSCWSEYIDQYKMAKNRVMDDKVSDEEGGLCPVLVQQTSVFEGVVRPGTATNDWAENIVHAIESRESMVSPNQYGRELDIIMKSVIKIQQRAVSQIPALPAASTVGVTMVPMRAKLSTETPTSAHVTPPVQSSSQPLEVSVKRIHASPTPPTATIATSSVLGTAVDPPPKVEKMKVVVTAEDQLPNVRHKKGVRQRGCPCCDPDNMDNIIDKLLYFDTPP